MKRVWYKHYPSDWRSDVLLKQASRAARSLWLDCLGLMYEGGTHRLEIAGQPMSIAQLSAALGDNPRTTRKLMKELEDCGVYTVDSDGFVTSRRILRDFQKAEKDRSNGRMGGNPALKTKGNEERRVNPPHKAQNQKPDTIKSRDTNVSLVPKPKIPKPERFQEFWDQYPHRGGAKKNRKGCEKKYAQAVARGVPEQTLISAAMRYASDRSVTDGYGRNPDTWLNQEGWTDDIESNRIPQQRNPGTHDGLFAGFSQCANADGNGPDRNDGDGESFDGSGDTAMDFGSGSNDAGPVFYLTNAR